jgi:hypothetical protein
MEKYNDLTGKSGVSYYKIGKDYIDIRFRTDPSSIYRYTNRLSGEKHIKIMKKLAISGEGLSTYISQHPEVRDKFEKH